VNRNKTVTVVGVPVTVGVISGDLVVSVGHFGPAAAALAPFLELAAPLRTSAQRDALAAYVIRKLHSTWSIR
jgi:hypothetical protein